MEKEVSGMDSLKLEELKSISSVIVAVFNCLSKEENASLTTRLVEVLRQSLYRRAPKDTPKIISELTKRVTRNEVTVSPEEVFELIIFPLSTHLSKAKETAITSATLLYGIYKAQKQKEMEVANFSSSDVFDYWRTIIEEDYNAGVFRVPSEYKKALVNYLTDLTKSQPKAPASA